MTEFPVNADGDYEIGLDPDAALPFAVAWYWFLRGDDKFWTPRTFVTPGETYTPSKADLNGHRYRCTAAGTTGSREPTWPTGSGGTVTDGGVTWTEIGAEDTIQTSTWEDGGLTSVGAAVDSTSNVASVTLSAAVAGTRYTVRNRIVSVGGKTQDQSFTVVGTEG